MRIRRRDFYGDPEYRARQSAATKAQWADPEYRARQSAATKAQWADPEYRARQGAALRAAKADPEWRARQAAAQKARWDDPEYRARQSTAIRAALASSETRAKLSAAVKARIADPEYRGRFLAAVADPGTRARKIAAQRAAMASPTYRAKIGAASKARWADPDRHARLSAAIRDAPVKGDCAYCGKPATTTDHVLPRNRGGTDDPANIVIACARCNQSKGNRTPEEWLAGGLVCRLRRGQALVEFALIVPVLLFLILAVVELGSFGARLIAWQGLVSQMAPAAAVDGSLPAWWTDEAAAAACGAPAASMSGTDPLRVTLACDYHGIAVNGLLWRVTVEGIATVPSPTP